MSAHINIKVKVIFPPIPKEIAISSAKLKVLCSKKEPKREDPAIHKDKYCSHKDLYGFVLGFVDEKLVGRVILLSRFINVDGVKVHLGGIGGVCTHPDYQGRGIASTLLKKGMSELYDQQCDIAYLCTNINDPKPVHLYEKFGFSVLDKPYTFKGKSGKKYISEDGMIAPLRSKKIAAQIFASKIPLDIGRGNW